MMCSISDAAYLPAGYADQPLPDGDIVEGFWRSERELVRMTALLRGHAVAATNVRNILADYFFDEGQVGWQDIILNRVR